MISAHWQSYLRDRERSVQGNTKTLKKYHNKSVKVHDALPVDHKLNRIVLEYTKWLCLLTLFFRVHTDWKVMEKGIIFSQVMESHGILFFSV